MYSVCCDILFFIIRHVCADSAGICLQHKFHFILSLPIILVEKAWQTSCEAHIFIYSVWSFESIHFSKYTPEGYIYFLNTLSVNVANLAIIDYFVKILILYTGEYYLFVYFYFPFPPLYFHWVWWKYNLKHIFMYCVPNFVDLSSCLQHVFLFLLFLFLTLLPLHGWDS